MDKIRKLSIGLLAIALCGCGSEPEKVNQKPNIIYIYTDQQNASMMTCAGNQWLKTPAMDYIANNGVRFTRAYVTNPVCTPSRVSMMTGRFPGYFNDANGQPVRENVGAMRIPDVSVDVQNATIAAYLKAAGYDLVFGGKEHLPKSLTPEALGFTDITNDERDELAMEAAKYISTPHEKPYFMVVSLINPHDICYMAIRDFAETQQEKRLLEIGETELATLDEALKLPEGVSEDEFFSKHCPPLPPNFEPQEDEPAAISWRVEQRNFQKQARDHYTEKQWRMHRWAYHRLTEVVDRQIQTILDALKTSGQEENTLVLLSSDHGEMDASHRLEHKSLLYEEAANVPFLAMWKGQIPAARVDSTHLISNGLDLLPTLCDYAGIDGKSDPRGKSLRPLFEGKEVVWREHLGVESQVGKMVVSADGLKYLRYDVVGVEENLIDLNNDPHEMTHFTTKPEYDEKLKELRSAFDQEWFPGGK
ncbi:MAG: sulfatase [Imperialibacter sp.]|uniref:sulfatase family protein n=1 Tax=Imperialibacter sp. TaxID=2038411 RepID=UPI003A8BB53D